MKILCFIMILSSLGNEKERIIIKYKEKEKFNFDEMGIGGRVNKDSDVDIRKRPKFGFKNKLPSKLDFTKEHFETIINYP